MVPCCGLFSIRPLPKAPASLCRGRRTVVHSWIPIGGISEAPARLLPAPSSALTSPCSIFDSQGRQLPSAKPGGCGLIYYLSPDVGYRHQGPWRAWKSLYVVRHSRERGRECPCPGSGVQSLYQSLYPGGEAPMNDRLIGVLDAWSKTLPEKGPQECLCLGVIVFY